MTAVVTRAHTRGTAWNSKATDSEFFTATNAIFVRRLQLMQLLSHGERQFVRFWTDESDVQPLSDFTADRAAMDPVDLNLVVQHGYPACRANVARR